MKLIFFLKKKCGRCSNAKLIYMRSFFNLGDMHKEITRPDGITEKIDSRAYIYCHLYV